MSHPRRLPDRATCLELLERIRTLQTEGHPTAVGSTGESLTVEGPDWSAMVPECYLRIGPGVVGQLTVPCPKRALALVTAR